MTQQKNTQVSNGFTIVTNISKENTNHPYPEVKKRFNTPTDEKKYSTEDVILILKAFHLDSVNGQYNKKLLDWCNNWIDYNVKNKL